MSTKGPNPIVTEAKLVQKIEEHEDPFVTAREVGDMFGVSRQTAYKHLQRLSESGQIEKKKIGSSAVIWWLPSGWG